jgi:anti-anti-sigma factor
MLDGGRSSPGAGFECSLTRSGDAVVARLRGELDLASARTLEHCLLAVVDARPPRVIVDLRALEFMGSTGLHAFTSLHARLGGDSQLLLVRGPARIQRIFEISGLAPTLRFVDAADVAADLAG